MSEYVNRRQEYVDNCRKNYQEKLNTQKHLIRYVKDKHGNRVGVVLAFKDETGNVNVGWSRCHVPLDRWNRYVGLEKARTHTYNIYDVDEAIHAGIADKELRLPNSLVEPVSFMVERAQKYFKVKE